MRLGGMIMGEDVNRRSEISVVNTVMVAHAYFKTECKT